MQIVIRGFGSLAFAACMYLGAGALCLALFEGTAINWDSAWTYRWLLAWPLGLALVFFKWFLIAATAALVIAAVIAIWEAR